MMSNPIIFVGEDSKTEIILKEKNFFWSILVMLEKFLKQLILIIGNEKINNNYYRHYSNSYENKHDDSCEFMAITISEGLKTSRRNDIQELTV